LDKVYLVAENEEAAKAISGKIEWLASHGSLVRLDAIHPAHDLTSQSYRLEWKNDGDDCYYSQNWLDFDFFSYLSSSSIIHC
jgi:hypothetical protein